MSALQDVLHAAADFMEDEADNRAAAGSEMSDYEREPRDLAERLRAAMQEGVSTATLADSLFAVVERFAFECDHVELRAVIDEALAGGVPAGQLSVAEMIAALLTDEGDAISLLSDNPEPPPNNAVECCGDWTDWKEQRFSGDCLRAAIRAAYEARMAAEAAA